jgi:uncharacterized protein (TIGR00725 family)
MQIAVIGPAACTEGEETAAEAIGRLIATHKGVLCCGGLGGVMEAACRGARNEGGLTVGIIPGYGDGNPFLDIVIRTGLGHARNVVLVQSTDAVVAVGGSGNSYGTLSEIAIALRQGKPVFGFMTWDSPGVIACDTAEEAALRAVRGSRP